jgi:hypothetical protein
VRLGISPAAYNIHYSIFEEVERNAAFTFSLFSYTLYIVHITVRVSIEKQEYASAFLDLNGDVFEFESANYLRGGEWQAHNTFIT